MKTPFKWFRKSPPLATGKKSFNLAQLAGSLSRLFGEGAGHETSSVTSFAAYQYYRANAPLATVIDKIADAVASVFPIVTDGENTITDHPALMLLQEPGYGRSYEEIVKEYVVAFKLTGNAYLNLVGPVERPPLSFHHVLPTRISIFGDRFDGFASRYSVNLGEFGGHVSYERTQDWRFTDGNLREIVHHRDIVDDGAGLFGRSPLDAIMVELDQRMAGSVLNSAFLSNGARNSGALIFKNELDDDQYQAVIQQLYANKLGHTNAGSVYVFAGQDVDFKEMSVNPRDMDYLNLLTLTANVVASRYNVPLPLISTETMTLSNYETAQLSFWVDCVIPLLNSILSTWTRGILRRFPNSEHLEFAFDRKQIEAIQLMNLEKATRMQATSSFTDNEVRHAVGYPAIEGGDQIFKPATSFPINDPVAPVDLSSEKSNFVKHMQALNMSELDASRIWHEVNGK